MTYWATSSTRSVENHSRDDALAPEVDWRAVAGMRDHLIHGYFDVDYEIVWDVVKRKMPELRSSIERLIGLLT